MPITDLTDSLPWWATQQGAGGGPGPTGGPAATPQGGGQGILAYLSQMFGISPAQAQQLMSAQQGAGATADMPSPNASPMAMKTISGDDFDRFRPPPGPPSSPLSSSFSSFPMRQPPPAQPTPPPVATANQPYGGPMAAADAAHAPTGGAYSHMPFPGQRDPQGMWGPLPSAGPMAAGGPVGGGGASGSGSTSNPRFIGIDRPNAPAEGGSRSGNSGLQGTALNLGGLFNRGQDAANAPAPNAQPMAAMRPAAGPLANAPMPPVMPGDIRNQRVRNAIRTPNWWQNL